MLTTNANEGPSLRRYGLELGIGMVDIFVGPTEQHFQVHKHLLCTYAPVFEKMFNGKFKEAIEASAKLPEDDCDAFHLFVEWLYTRHLTLPAANIPKSAALFDPIKLYCFAEKYCLAELMDYTMSYILALLEARNWLPGLEHMQYAYDHSPAGSTLRKFMPQALKFVALEVGDKSTWPTAAMGRLMATNEELTVDFLALLRQSGGEVVHNPRHASPCEYHIHGKSEKCTVATNAFVSN